MVWFSVRVDHEIDHGSSMLPDDVLPGEGDCDHDDQCAGLLECGHNNCLTKTGGLWDQGRVQHYKEITDYHNPLYLLGSSHKDNVFGGC